MNEPMMSVVHFREVRNAWFGPETWVEVVNRPPHVSVDEAVEAEFRALAPRYFRVEPEILTRTIHYARWDRWAFAKGKAIWLDWFYGTLWHLARKGILHVCKPEAERATWRDIRIGPSCYGWLDAA